MKSLPLSPNLFLGKSESVDFYFEIYSVFNFDFKILFIYEDIYKNNFIQEMLIRRNDMKFELLPISYSQKMSS